MEYDLFTDVNEDYDIGWALVNLLLYILLSRDLRALLIFNMSW